MSHCPVSVVIPSFNCGRLVVQAVESVLAQTSRPTEIIVVDDGSTDDTRERLVRYRDYVRYVYQPNQGVSAARNHGIRLATQEFVAFLDADDVWHPLKMQLQMPLFGQSPAPPMVGSSQFDWPASRFPDVDLARPFRVSAMDWAYLVVKNDLPTSSIVVRRSVLERVGPFDLSLQGPEDRDMWLRVAEIAPIARVELPLMGYRDVPGSVSKQADRCRTGLLRILRKQDQTGRWRGRWLLRRKAYSYVYHTCSEIYNTGGRYPAAAANCLKSLLWYPLAYRPVEVTTRAERPKRLAVSLLRWCRLKAPARPRPAEFDADTPDALQVLRREVHLQFAE
ncbi:MAG TPA: glycosyltransferase [Gemmataceae bacterium]|nr:glycosyltransferase [Gemmataceae bacterium]